MLILTICLLQYCLSNRIAILTVLPLIISSIKTYEHSKWRNLHMLPGVRKRYTGSTVPLLSYAAMSGKLHVDDRPNAGLGVEQQAFYARY